MMFRLEDGHRGTWVHRTAELKSEETEWAYNGGRTWWSQERGEPETQGDSQLFDCEWANSFQSPNSGLEQGCMPGQVWATGPNMQTHVHGKEDPRAGSQAPSTSSGNNCSLPPNEHQKAKQKTCHPNNPSWFTRREGVLKIDSEEIVLKYANYSTCKQLIIYNNLYLLVIWILWTTGCWNAYWYSSLRGVDIFI